MALTFHVTLPDGHLRAVGSKEESLFLRLNGILHPPREGFVVRVFLNDLQANAQTPTRNNPNYIGEAPILANEYLPEAERAADVPWARRTTSPPRRDFDPPITLEWDVSAMLENWQNMVPVTIVLLNGQGEELPSDSLHLEAVELVREPM